ncbi:hypothetical protein NQZ68_020560 [Dissostichus eleginoides]|nr:hypothetical protein NQZ68_020560 [Dissostichus eleginoides]
MPRSALDTPCLHPRHVIYGCRGHGTRCLLKGCPDGALLQTEVSCAHHPAVTSGGEQKRCPSQHQQATHFTRITGEKRHREPVTPQPYAAFVSGNTGKMVWSGLRHEASVAARQESMRMFSDPMLLQGSERRPPQRWRSGAGGEEMQKLLKTGKVCRALYIHLPLGKYSLGRRRPSVDPPLLILRLNAEDAERYELQRVKYAESCVS